MHTGNFLFTFSVGGGSRASLREALSIELLKSTVYIAFRPGLISDPLGHEVADPIFSPTFTHRPAAYDIVCILFLRAALRHRRSMGTSSSSKGKAAAATSAAAGPNSHAGGGTAIAATAGRASADVPRFAKRPERRVRRLRSLPDNTSRYSTMPESGGLSGPLQHQTLAFVTRTMLR